MTENAGLFSKSRSRTVPIIIWALRILLGLGFLLFALTKFSGQQAMIDEFNVVGLGQWFRYFTASLELIGGIAVLIPAISIPGAILMLIVDLGAFVAQIAVLHIDWIHTVVIAALLLVLIYFQRSRLGFWR